MSTVKLLLVLSLTASLSKGLEWKFPDDFKFGVATSAYQIEGGWNADGKATSIWDIFSRNRSELIADGSNGDIACDSYHKWEEDVEMVKNLGVDYYRLSLAWTRILPDGYGTAINQAGVDYYNKIINKLLENGIEPVLTLYHWDLPQVFGVLGGWANPIVIEHFANYARTAFELFGDRVKIWITLNEPRLICQVFKGLAKDITTPYPLGVVEYLCAHNVLKAHAEAYHIYDREFRYKQKGKISITMDFTWTEPFNKTNIADVKAADRWIQSEFGLYANPIFGFDYPKVVIDTVANRSKLEGFKKSRLPKFTLSEKLRIKGTYDYLGINHYIVYYVQACEEPPIGKPHINLDGGGCRFQDESWEQTAAKGAQVVPWGLRHLLQWIKNAYGNPEIMITENGYTDASENLNDTGRINYYKGYLNATLQAILEDGVNVKTYMAWSLMDNFEWDSGYTQKYGLYHVNFTDPNRIRTPKRSVEFFKNVTRTRTIE